MAKTIMDEIKRIQEAKIKLRNVIESKGVAVDPEATIDKYPVFVENIGDITLEDISITANDTYTAPEGKAYKTVDVNVSASANLQTLTVTANNTYTPTAPVDGYDEVIVNVQPNLTTLNATSNDTYTPTSPYVGYSEVTVNVQPGVQESSVTLYYNMNQEKLYNNSYMTDDESWWIFNPDGGGSALMQNVDKMYIDGVLQNSIEWKHKFTTGGMHTVKLVLKSNANEIPDWSLRGYKYIDTRNFTGTLGVLDYNMNENFYILPENITLGGPGGGGYYYLPASTSLRQNDHRLAFPFWVDKTHQSYTNNVNGSLVMDSNNNVVGLQGRVFIPESVTDFQPESIQDYAQKIVLPKTLTAFHGVQSGAGTLAFLGTTPPTITPLAGYGQAEGPVFVPSGSESAYYTAFTNAGWGNMAANTQVISTVTASFTYASGDSGIVITNNCESATEGNMLLVEIYDSNNHCIFQECPTNELNIMGELLNGYGNYTVKIYFVDKVYSWWESPHHFFANSTATSVDFSGMVTREFGRYNIYNAPNLTEVTLSDAITSIGEQNFNSCGNLSKVYINAPQPPYIDGSGTGSGNFENSNGGNPIDVIVPDASVYRQDAEWANLESRGLITLVTA